MTVAQEHDVVEAPAVGRGRHLGLVVADFHRDLAEAMLEAAEAKARDLGFDPGPVVRVTGTYDTPLPAARLLARPDVAGVVVVGAIVTGETDHDELIGHSTARSLHQVSLEAGKPVGLAITGPGQSMAEAQARVARAADAVTAIARVLAGLEELPGEPDPSVL